MEIRDKLYTASVGPMMSDVKKVAAKAGDAPATISTSDAVTLSGKTESTASKTSVQAAPVKQEAPAAETIAPQGIKLSDVPVMNKDLYKVASDGKTTKVTFIYDPGGRETLNNLKLVGSWDNNSGKFTNEWKNSGVAMQKLEDGRFAATIALVEDQSKDWRWGVFADAPTGKQQWAVFEESSLKFDPSAKDKTFTYAPTNYHKMGSHREGNDIGFRYWAPNAKDVQVKVWGDDPKQAQFIPMEKDQDNGMWAAKVEGGWKDMAGKNYMYSITTAEGKKVDRLDPYARDVQGVQRGISTVYIHHKTGQPAHQFWYENNKPAFVPMTRFEVQDQGDASAVYLRLTDETGKTMTKEDMEARLGKFDSELVKNYNQGKFNDFYANNFDDQGRIKMVKQGRAWTSMIHNQDRLPGLKYQFEVYKKDANGQLQLVGDKNKDGVLQDSERKITAFNDPYTNEIQPEFGAARAGVIKDPSAFQWKNDNAPRMAETQNKYVIYQIHTGSIFGDSQNADRSTFKDLIKKLEYFKDLGVNTLELLPTNMTENNRDWGYIGTNSFAQTNNYGFIDDSGNFVSGTDALKQFVDAAHGMGFNVVNDVVYNHFGGAYNHVWESDGKANSWFNWDNETKATTGNGLFKSVNGGAPQGQELRGVLNNAVPYSTEGRTEPDKEKSGGSNSLYKDMKNTPWGSLPAFNKKPVRDFVVNNAMMQFDELHLDGVRFDFTHPLHEQGWGGGTDGWNMLRRMNREIHFFHPGSLTSAEEFPNSPAITAPAGPEGSGGAGFNTMWNTEYQHRLVHSSGGSSILQQAAHGWRTDVDNFMDALINHPGFGDWMNSITMISNHDEVGNAERTVVAASGDQNVPVPSQWARNASRMTFATGMLSPGIPMFFQGDESLSQNQFKWGVPASWDLGWEWQETGKDWNWSKINVTDGQLAMYDSLASMQPEQRNNDSRYKGLSAEDKKVCDFIAAQQPENRNEAKENIARKSHFNFCKDMISLRKSSPAFDGDAEVNRVYSHNDNSVLAFHRKKNGEEFIMVGSLNKNNLQNYNIPLRDGKWQLVFNSDNNKYGGGNYGDGKPWVDGNGGTCFDIPAGGMLVYKKV
ncbi:MAG: alpha amylase C-terminal domain-containing protein [Firmicutes bacterium]|nr:alpha amylase C-terminal domain-containing protein [Bacillota bacterium]